MFLEDSSICIGEPNKVDGRWASSHLLRAQIEQKGKERLDTLSPPDRLSWDINIFLSSALLVPRPSVLGWNLRSTPSAFKPVNYSAGLLGPLACRRQIIKLLGLYNCGS